MSYDLDVYADVALSAAQLRALVVDVGLGVDAGPPAAAVRVLDGPRGRSLLTLALPEPLDAEDVPHEVLAVLGSAGVVYEIAVVSPAPAAAETTVPEDGAPVPTDLAVDLARSLARATSGAVLDQQTGEVWARVASRSAPPLPVGVVDTVEVHWYARGGADPGLAAEAWQRLARRYLPEALPRRFGTTETLPQHVDAARPRVFADAVRAADDTVHYLATPPVLEGHLEAGPSDAAALVSHGLTVQREALTDPVWRTAFQRLFVSFAAEVDAVVATAEVVRGAHWTGQSLGYDASTEPAVYLAPRGAWAGLPPYPVWWAWFGADLAPRVAPCLRGDRVELSGQGLFHWRSEAPADRDALQADLASGTDLGAVAGGTVHAGWWRRLLRRRPAHRRAPASGDGLWLPEDLLAMAGAGGGAGAGVVVEASGSGAGGRRRARRDSA